MLSGFVRGAFSAIVAAIAAPVSETVNVSSTVQESMEQNYSKTIAVFTVCIHSQCFDFILYNIISV